MNERPDRTTELWVATLWIVTAAGAIAGAALINPVLGASEGSAWALRNRLALGALGWLVNNVGIVFIGLLMVPLLKRHSEVMAWGYLVMRVIEAVLITVGIVFALLLIPVGEAASAPSHDAVTVLAAVLKHAENWLVNLVPLVFLSVGGLILNLAFLRTRMIPRFLALWGLVSYALLLPATVVGLLGRADPTPGGAASIVALPVALWEIVLMPAWLYARGFRPSPRH